MTKTAPIRHEFVEFIPEALQAGTLYVSIPYTTAVHLCMCGCGNKVVTPIQPTDWLLTFDGESISLSPSVGNWSFPCQSHYWIRHGSVVWDKPMSRERIAAVRAHDQLLKEHALGGTRRPVASVPSPEHPHRAGLLARLRELLVGDRDSA